MKVDRAAGVLRGSWLRAARVAWILLATLALGVLLSSLPGYVPRFRGWLAHVPAEQAAPSTAIIAPLSALASLGSAALSLGLAWMIYRRRFQERAAAVLAFYLLIYGIVMAGPLEHWGVYWLGSAEFALSLQASLLVAPTVALYALFPNGRFVPGWTRWAALASLPVSVLALIPGMTDYTWLSPRPPLMALAVAIYVGFFALGFYAQVYRYRRVSTYEERQQTRWVIYGFALWFLYIVISTGPYFYLTSLPEGATVPWWAAASELGWWLALNILPVTLTIAITHYRLWNIDLLINRTLVYAALTACVVALYILLVGGLGLAFRTGDSLLLPLLATGLAAVMFQPLRERLQGAVNRMMYGERDEPVAVLAKLREQLERTGEPDENLASLVETIALALKLPYAAIEWGEGAEVAASYGVPANTLKRFPLLYQGEIVGRLVVAGRALDEPLSPKDLQLLENIAHQAGAAAYTAFLTSDLQRARERLVAAREEERRRLRRDLHDGLGTELASLTLKLDAARNLLADDRETSERMLGELKAQVQDAVGEVRRLVYNLRPPALDELGLMSALRERAAAFPADQGMMVQVEGPEQLPPLPAAVEVAAYRVAQEAVKNAAEHGQARNCWVRLRMQDGLTLEVVDDGCGISEEFRAGVGITSMKERAAELGGSFRVDPAPSGGTRVVVWLPVEGRGR